MLALSRWGGPVYSGDFARAAAVQPDGSIVVAGMTNGGVATAPLRVMVARYLPDGSLDPAFGSGGVVRTKLRSFAAVRAVAIQRDGKIVVAGDGVVRYLPNGRDGGTASLTYNTQKATFPTGFGAEFYARWKCNGTFTSIERSIVLMWFS